VRAPTGPISPHTCLRSGPGAVRALRVARLTNPPDALGPSGRRRNSVSRQTPPRSATALAGGAVVAARRACPSPTSAPGLVFGPNGRAGLNRSSAMSRGILHERRPPPARRKHSLRRKGLRRPLLAIRDPPVETGTLLDEPAGVPTRLLPSASFRRPAARTKISRGASSSSRISSFGSRRHRALCATNARTSL
jgi:hypothetical protein